MVNILVAIAISLVQIAIAILLVIKNKYIEKSDIALRHKLGAIVIGIFTLAFNILLLKQDAFNILMMINLCFAYTVVLASGVIDSLVKKIPNMILLSGMIARLIMLIVELIWSRETIKQSLLSSVIGLLVSLFVMLIISFISKQGIGYGDVKLFAYLGFVLGILDTYYVLFYAVLFAAIYAAVMLLRKKVDRKNKIPFGPFIYLGFVMVYIFVFI